MAMCGGRGRIGYFAGKMELNKEYTTKDIKRFYEDHADDLDNEWPDISREEAKSVLWGLIRSQCYNVTVLQSPKRIILNERYVYKSPEQLLSSNFVTSNKYNALLSTPFLNLNLS